MTNKRTNTTPIKSTEAKEIIRNLNKINLEAENFEYIKNQITRLFNGLAMQTSIPKKESKFFRGVKFETKPLTTSYLSYPPANLVRNFQRCNRPQAPMFYCAVDPSAVFFELRVRPGDKIYLSEWSTLKEFAVNRLAVEDTVDLRDLVRDVILTFAETKFSQPVHDTYSSQYKVTAAIAELLANGDLIGERVLGGLGYPSVAHPGRIENVAIRPEVVDSCLKLDHVEEVSILKVEGDEIIISYTDFSENFGDGRIHWLGRSSDRIRRPGVTLIVSRGPDGWVTRDENGSIVNPG